jgi:hypothetical protein
MLKKKHPRSATTFLARQKTMRRGWVLSSSASSPRRYHSSFIHVHLLLVAKITKPTSTANNTAMTTIQTIAGINRCPQCEQTRMFSPTACWQAGQVFIEVKVFSSGGGVKCCAISNDSAKMLAWWSTLFAAGRRLRARPTCCLALQSNGNPSQKLALGAFFWRQSRWKRGPRPGFRQ